jgi:hypothetical protein
MQSLTDNRTGKQSYHTKFENRRDNGIEKRHQLNLVGKYCTMILGKNEIFYYTLN